MAVGVSTTLANSWLDALRGSAYSESATYIGLHTANPGTAGTTAVSSVTTRPAVTFAAASSGAIAMNGTAPSWTNWAGTNGEVVTHFSVWDAATSGNFLFSGALTSSKTVNTGDTLTFATLTVTFTTAS